MIQSLIDEMFSINKELKVDISMSKIQGGCCPSSLTIDAVKNPAYKSINSSQTINAVIVVDKNRPQSV